jgi:hypothetical protein
MNGRIGLLPPTVFGFFPDRLALIAARNILQT